MASPQPKKAVSQDQEQGQVLGAPPIEDAHVGAAVFRTELLGHFGPEMPARPDVRPGGRAQAEARQSLRRRR
eukprot:2444546-Alexandrium_andersonii.AAC.1